MAGVVGDEEHVHIVHAVVVLKPMQDLYTMLSVRVVEREPESLPRQCNQSTR